MPNYVVPMFGIARFLDTSVAALVRAAFPDHCVFCGSETAGGHFCIACRFDLPRLGHCCPRCGQPVTAALSGATGCGDCQRRPPPFTAARAAVLYAFPVDAALKSFKFGHHLYYGPAFAELLFAEYLKGFQHSFQDTDALVAVPLHARRHALRGFNQAAELCKPLARLAGLPRVRNVHRIRYTRQQTGLDAAARRKNLRGAFAVRGRLRCRHPLIVDDVMTTGETCRQLAQTLSAAGAHSVTVLTLARAAAPRR